MIKLFEQIREHLEKQYLEVNFDPSTGLSPEEIVSELEHHRKQYPDEPQIMTKAWLFHLLCTKGRIVVDPDDYFADKLEHNDIMLKLRGEISRHREHTGSSNRLILSNLEQLSQCGVPIEIRIPVIPQFNSDEASINAIGKWLSRLPNTVEVQLLPYHEVGRSKYETVGHPDIMPNVPVATQEEMHFAAARLRRFGLNVKQN